MPDLGTMLRDLDRAGYRWELSHKDRDTGTPGHRLFVTAQFGRTIGRNFWGVTSEDAVLEALECLHVEGYGA